MSDLDALDGPPPRPPAEPKRRRFWRYLFLGLVVLMGYCASRCGLAMVDGGKHADEAVAAFHVQLDGGRCAQGDSISATFQTRFERGTAVERFTFLDEGGTRKLLGWHVDSNDLVTL